MVIEVDRRDAMSKYGVMSIQKVPTFDNRLHVTNMTVQWHVWASVSNFDINVISICIVNLLVFCESVR